MKFKLLKTEDGDLPFYYTHESKGGFFVCQKLGDVKKNIGRFQIADDFTHTNSRVTKLINSVIITHKAENGSIYQFMINSNSDINKMDSFFIKDNPIVPYMFSVLNIKTVQDYLELFSKHG